MDWAYVAYWGMGGSVGGDVVWLMRTGGSGEVDGGRVVVVVVVVLAFLVVVVGLIGAHGGGGGGGGGGGVCGRRCGFRRPSGNAT